MGTDFSSESVPICGQKMFFGNANINKTVKTQFPLRMALGIASEILYALGIILLAFLICGIIYFKR
jgi:hypothetical protein